MVTTICFDLDGTLTDPKPGITGCIQYALERLGHPVPSMDDLTWCIGPPLLGSFEELTGDQEQAERAIGFYRERFGDIGYRENALYPDIIETLSMLCEAGARLLVATSKPTVYASRIIEHFGLGEFFEDVCGSELDGSRADKTDLLAWMVAERNIVPSHAVMIGDRRHDVIGAHNNGIASIGVLYGYGSREELSEAGAMHLCELPAELQRLLVQV